MSILAAIIAVGALLLSSVGTVTAQQSPFTGGRLGSPVVGQSPDFQEFWVASHAATPLWSGPDATASIVESLHQWSVLRVVRPQQGQRLPVHHPRGGLYAWVDAHDVGPIDPSLAGTGYLPPMDGQILWSGAALITMYTCVELGGCAPTASGIWPTPGVVAVDPTVIPLGSLVWVEGLGTYLAADTGSLVRGAHIDVFHTSYWEAVDWGVQHRSIVVLSGSSGRVQPSDFHLFSSPRSPLRTWFLDLWQKQ